MTRPSTDQDPLEFLANFWGGVADAFKQEEEHPVPKDWVVPSKIKRRVTARKYMGDDAYSWAVFVDNRVAVTGLSRSEVDYHRHKAHVRLARAAGLF